MRLKGKVALVTGGAMGIGGGIVRRFVAEGAQVAICDIADDVGHALAAELGDAALYLHLDVRSRAAWGDVVAEVETTFGPINILVNNAGIGAQTYVETAAIDAFQNVIDINLMGVLYGMQLGIPSLRKSGDGVILNISSLQGLEADVGLTAYVATKFAVRGITKSAALELAKEGIRANSIHPGMIRTPAMGGQKMPEDYFGKIPLRRSDRPDRAGYPEDVGHLAVFLASDDASYVTGAEFVIDGGKSVRFTTKIPAKDGPHAETAPVRLQDRIVLISGTGPIAGAIADRFTAGGCRVIHRDAIAQADLTGAEEASILVTVASDATCVSAAGQAVDAALPALRRAGGAIVHVALPMGTESTLGLTAYGAATAGLLGYTRASAIALGDDSIRVNLVQPGLLAGTLAEEEIGLLPLHRRGDGEKRMGEIDDIVNAVLFLASDEAGYIHGAEFTIDGGLSECRNSRAGRAWDTGTSGWGT